MTSADRDFELQRIHVASVRAPEGGFAQAFVIDGRDYTDAEAMKCDLDEAWDELTRRRVGAEWETRPTAGQSRLSWLPSWKEYRQRLGDGDRRIGRMGGRDIRVFSSWRTWDDARLALSGLLSAATLDHLDQAMAYALACHQGQTRPNGEPYAEHLLEVLEILVVGAGVRDDEVLVAALLHDVVEDTSSSLEDVGARFGPEVADLVQWLTKPEPGSGQKESDARQAYLARLRGAPEPALVVKLADRLSNVQRLDTHPRPAKRASYYRETVDHFLPLSERHPWFSREFTRWKEAFRDLEPDSGVDPVPQDRPDQ